MAEESVELGEQTKGQARGWKSAQVYAMAGICLGIGVTLGYLFRGSAAPSPAPVQAADKSQSPAAQMPTLYQMKHMADKQAEPLLVKLQADPKNATLLNQIGTIYKATHQFKEASGFYERAVDVDPKNVAARTDLASCLFYDGDADGALNQLQQSLKYDPNDANSLFNLGMIRWQAKNDAGGAVTAWQQLLKSNPRLADDKKAQVEKLIAQAKKHTSANN